MARGDTGQHTGAGGRDTAWLEVVPNAPAPRLAPFGGALASAVAVLAELTGFCPDPL